MIGSLTHGLSKEFNLIIKYRYTKVEKLNNLNGMIFRKVTLTKTLRFNNAIKK